MTRCVSARGSRFYLTARGFCLAMSVAAVVSASHLSEASTRPWVALDSIQTQYAVVNAGVPQARYGGRGFAPQVSPDGEYFFYLTNEGRLQDDAEVYTLNVYRVSRVRTWLAGAAGERKETLSPERVVSVSSTSSKMAGIEQARWGATGHTVWFLGVTDAGTQELHRLDVDSGAMTRVTQPGDRTAGSQIEWFATSGDGVLYQDFKWSEKPPVPYPMEWVPMRPDGSIIRRIEARTQMRAAYVGYRGQTLRRVEKAGSTGRWDSDRVWLSPDGRRAIALGIQTVGASKQVQRDYSIIDLEAARNTPMTGMVPKGTFGAKATVPSPAAYWSADSSRAIVVNATAPREFTDSTGADVPCIVAYEPASGRGKVLEALGDTNAPRQVSAVGWLKPGEELLVTHTEAGQPAQGTAYRFTSDGVSARTVDASMKVPAAGGSLEGVSIRLTQSPNEAMRIVAADGTHEAVLWASNPQLQKVTLARTEPFEWQDADGQRVTGGLTLPPGYAKGEPLPLVIQVSKYFPRSFLPDGPDRTSGSTQAFAALGIAVLQIDVPKDPLQGDRFPLMDRVDAIVRALAEKGLVDPARVAMNSAHEAGDHTYLGITHPGQVRLAAVIAADFSSAASYPSYLVQGGALGRELFGKYFEQGMGGSFWENKQRWMQIEPTFNVNRVQAPLLVSGHGAVSELSRRDAYYIVNLLGAFALNDKPMDYLYLPQGDFQLLRPLERLLMMDTVVDWTAFWLQGYEDPSPHKIAQYARWRPMRLQLQKTQQPNRMTSQTQAPGAPATP